MYPTTCKEAVEKWDKGETLWTIEMGGLGPGYEQAIQMLMVEMLRDHCEDVIPEDEDEKKVWWKQFGETAVHRTDDAAGGYSGAQVGAAKNLAFHFMRDGWEKVMSDEQVKDRHIIVSNFWPRTRGEE